MYYTNVDIIFERPRTSVPPFFEWSYPVDVFPADMATMVVSADSRYYRNRPGVTGVFLGLACKARALLTNDPVIDGIGLMLVKDDEHTLNGGRFSRFDPNMFENKITTIGSIADTYGDLLDDLILEPMVEWFHEHTVDTDITWNVAMEVVKESGTFHAVKIVYAFYVSDPTLAVLLRLELP